MDFRKDSRKKLMRSILHVVTLICFFLIITVGLIEFTLYPIMFLVSYVLNKNLLFWCVKKLNNYAHQFDIRHGLWGGE